MMTTLTVTMIPCRKGELGAIRPRARGSVRANRNHRAAAVGMPRTMSDPGRYSKALRDMGDVAARRERADRHIVIEVADVHEAEPEHLREQRGIAAHDRQSQETERQQIERAVGQSGPGEADQRRGKPVAS